MTNRENDAQYEVPTLTWVSKKVWGSVGLTYCADITIDADTWKFTVDQPRKGDWAVRAWTNGWLTIYDDAETLSKAKALAQLRFSLAVKGSRS